MDSKPHFIDSVVLIQPLISLWQGNKSNTREDFRKIGIDVDSLPEEKLSSLGTMKTIPKESLAKFMSIKREAHAVCSRYGVRFAEGYAINEAFSETILSELNNLKKEFNEYKELFIDNYTVATESWISNNDPKWQGIIRSKLDYPEKVARQIKFGFIATKLKSLENIAADDGISDQCNGLLGQLQKEIRLMASQTYKASYQGADSVGIKALRPLSTIQHKLEALCMLDSSLLDLAKEIANLIYYSTNKMKMCKLTQLRGDDLQKLVSLLMKLSTLGIQVNTKPETEDVLETFEIVDKFIKSSGIEAIQYDF